MKLYFPLGGGVFTPCYLQLLMSFNSDRRNFSSLCTFFNISTAQFLTFLDSVNCSYQTRCVARITFKVRRISTHK